MKCPICGGSSTDLLYSLPKGPIRSCSKCTTVFRENLVAEDAAHDLYDADSYLDSPFFDALKVGARADVEPYLIYRKVLDQLEEILPAGRLLDVGCSYGAFLELARSRGWQVTGVELSSKSSSYAAEKRGLQVFTGTLEEAGYPADHFSAITLWDVIEHLDRPVETLRETCRILAAGGILVVFTINQRSLINRAANLLYRASFGRIAEPLVRLYPIVHNFYFDQKSLTYALRAGGFAGPIEIDWADAHLDRWTTVSIPPLLSFGVNCLDVASHWIGQRYRMTCFASK